VYSERMSTNNKPLDCARDGQRGAIFALALIVFIICLLLAGILRLLLWSQENNQALPLIGSNVRQENTADNSATDDLLTSQFVVGNGLRAEQAILTKKLFEPMRQYYATNSDRLGDAAVTKSDDEEHSATVIFTLETDAGPVEQVFFYDREGEEKSGDWQTWEPGMLDNTE